MTRGLTLIELLLALVLLAAIVSATAAWTQVAGRIATATEPARISSAANAVLQLISDDLSCGDFQFATDEERIQRVAVVDEALQIRTRDDGRGDVLHQYRFDLDSKSLRLRSHGGANDQDRERLLLVGVTNFECEIDDEHTQLTIEMTIEPDRLLSRRYVLR